jgi:hypothetical protein
MVAVGTCTVAANQSGNTQFKAAPTVSRSFTVRVPEAELTQRLFLPVITKDNIGIKWCQRT